MRAKLTLEMARFRAERASNEGRLAQNPDFGKAVIGPGLTNDGAASVCPTFTTASPLGSGACGR
jgi:hypothetical protein